MGSRGSVKIIFNQFRDKNYIPITDKRMTRFNITLQEAINFVLNSFTNYARWKYLCLKFHLLKSQI